MIAHRDRAFSTPDWDNDLNYYYDCAINEGAGWWYNNCYTANLNGGEYLSNDFALYNEDTNTYQYNLQYSQMKIRPA